MFQKHSSLKYNGQWPSNWQKNNTIYMFVACQGRCTCKFNSKYHRLHLRSVIKGVYLKFAGTCPFKAGLNEQVPYSENHFCAFHFELFTLDTTPLNLSETFLRKRYNHRL